MSSRDGPVIRIGSVAAPQARALLAAGGRAREARPVGAGQAVIERHPRVVLVVPAAG
jgi:hypothetical protein